ncbi:OprD family porin [Pseudomonas sp. PDM31]|nr:OprD family porin [Pseudomonas sp. PDM31]
MAIFLAAILVFGSASTFASDISESDFVKKSTLSILNRNYYYDRDFSGENVKQSQRREWAQGAIAKFSSGYTPGTVGFGVDAIGMFGLKLDSSSDRIGTGLLASSGKGIPGVDEAQDQYSKAVGAVKVKVSNSVLKIGGQIVKNPVVSLGDSRLLPETVDGVTFSSTDISKLLFEAGHLTSLRRRDQTDRASGPLQEADYVGGKYDFTKDLSASLYSSSIQNYWDNRFIGINWLHSLDAKQAVGLQYNAYQQKSIGDELGGDLDNYVFSLQGSYSYLGSTFTVANQQVSGRGPHQYLIDGTSTLYLSNFIQVMDAVNEDENSWKLQYDLNFAQLGLPGLTFTTVYAMGDNIKVGKTVSDGKEWETDFMVRYVVQSGRAKGLSTQVKAASYRSDFKPDVHELRLVTEYPLNIF